MSAKELYLSHTGAGSSLYQHLWTVILDSQELSRNAIKVPQQCLDMISIVRFRYSSSWGQHMQFAIRKHSIKAVGLGSRSSDCGHSR